MLQKEESLGEFLVVLERILCICWGFFIYNTIISCINPGRLADNLIVLVGNL